MAELNDNLLDEVNGGMNKEEVVYGDYAGGIVGDKDGYDFRATGAAQMDGAIIVVE